MAEDASGNGDARNVAEDAGPQGDEGVSVRVGAVGVAVGGGGGDEGVGFGGKG